MIDVVIIGTGGVAEAMAMAAAQGESLRLVAVAGRNARRCREIAQMVGCEVSTLDALPVAEVYILAVSDGAIGELMGRLTFGAGSVVVHTAGSVSAEGLDGVIYPMQSFTPHRRVCFREVPLFVEGGDGRIQMVANALSDRVVTMSSEQRVKLHLAAVFASNFVNAMFSATSEILAQNSLDIELYRPLITETFKKVFEEGMEPKIAQTGPAKRGDLATQARHLEAMESENLTEIYKTISKYIWETSKRI